MKKKRKNKKKIRHRSRWVKGRDLGFYDPHAGEKPAKVRVTTYFDSDVLRFFKKIALELGEGYQTVINRVLRIIFNNSNKEKDGYTNLIKLISEELVTHPIESAPHSQSELRALGTFNQLYINTPDVSSINTVSH